MMFWSLFIITLPLFICCIVCYMRCEDIVTEYFAYNYFYKWYYINGEASQRIYQLSAKYDDRECAICYDEFEFDEIAKNSNCILKCGHRYHSKCIREWELEQFTQNSSASYKCPLCKTEYGWKQKWHYHHH
eukprot:UN01407